MKKRLFGLLSLLLVVCIAVGCGKKSANFDGASSFTKANSTAEMAAESSGLYADEDMGDYNYGYDNGSADYYPAGDTMTPPIEQAEQVADPNRKLIKNVYMNVETKEFEALMQLIEQQVSLLGGYIESSEVYNGSRYDLYSARTRNASIVARIPQTKLNTFVGAVSEVGNVTNKSESVQDITLQYVDTESHKEALKVEYDRLLELLEKAETMEDIIYVEDRLTSVRYQLQSMESQLRTYDNKVNFSTVTMNISEVEELTPIVEETVSERISSGFVSSLHEVRDGFVEFFIGFIVALPHLVVWAVIIAIIVMIVIIVVKKAGKNREKKLAIIKQRNAGRSINDVISSTKNTDKADNSDVPKN